MQAEAHMIAKTHEPAAAGPIPAQAVADASPRFRALDAGAAQLMAACADDDFLAGLLRQLVRFGSRGGDRDDVFMTSVIKGIKPRDKLEVMLAAQMVSVHI